MVQDDSSSLGWGMGSEHCCRIDPPCFRIVCCALGKLARSIASRQTCGNVLDYRRFDSVVDEALMHAGDGSMCKSDPFFSPSDVFTQQGFTVGLLL